MRVVICPDAASAGTFGGAEVAARLNRVLSEGGRARMLLSTGQSQFETLGDLVRRPVDWERVDAFHLDEYVGLGAEHPASFRRYLSERVERLVPLRMHYVNPESAAAMAELVERVAESPMDVALIGVGENGHLAFNDPPADLKTKEVYLKVDLDAQCRAQQVGEGWFEGIADVPTQAMTMSIPQIMRANQIVSVVPHAVKAPAVRRLLSSGEVSAELPASMLHRHDDVTLVLDRNSAGLLPLETWRQCVVL